MSSSMLSECSPSLTVPPSSLGSCPQSTNLQVGKGPDQRPSLAHVSTSAPTSRWPVRQENSILARIVRS